LRFFFYTCSSLGLEAAALQYLENTVEIFVRLIASDFCYFVCDFDIPKPSFEVMLDD
jgi:hypothetical protein